MSDADWMNERLDAPDFAGGPERAEQIKAAVAAHFAIERKPFMQTDLPPHLRLETYR